MDNLHFIPKNILTKFFKELIPKTLQIQLQLQIYIRVMVGIRLYTI